MLMKGRLKEIIQGLSQGVIRVWKGSVEENSSAYRKGIRSNLILMKGPSKGNKLCLITARDLITVTRNES